MENTIKQTEFYGAGYPYLPPFDIPGKLIVLEGKDGVGRSTQIQLLKQWLEQEGYAVSDTGLKRSALTQPGLEGAKQGHTFSPVTMSLFYATDFADRLENQIIPALRAGFIVLSDRYFYSIIARDIIRGADPEWAKQIYGFALKPDLILYLDADITKMVSRIMHGRGLNYWESGMDMHFADNLFDSFIIYQNKLSKQFAWMEKEYNFRKIDANRSIHTVFQELKNHIQPFLDEEKLPEEK